MTDIIRTTTNFVDSWVANVVQINTVTILQALGCSKGGYPGWGGGGTPGNSWWGVCRPVLQILTRSQTKDVIFHTHFSHPFSDLAFRHKLCYHNLD